MVTLQLILPFLLVGDFLTSPNPRDVYVHVPGHRDSQTFLRFCVGSEHFQFQVLHFRLSALPLVFTKVLPPLVGLVHAHGIPIELYKL